MRPRPSHNAVLQGYPIRSHSFVYSLGVHGVVVVLLLMAPRLQSPPDISVREQIMELESRKIVYYDLRKVLPDVKPVEKVGDSILPQIGRAHV